MQKFKWLKLSSKIYICDASRRGEAVVMKDLRNREKCVYVICCLYVCLHGSEISVLLCSSRLCGPILHWEMFIKIFTADSVSEISILLELDPRHLPSFYR